MGARKKKSKKPSGTRAELLLEQTTFFADICLGRHVGESLRAAGMKVEFHLDHFTADAPDDEWLPSVGVKQWVVLTKDKAIRRKPSEREQVISAKIRMFTLPSGNMTGDEMTSLFLNNRLKMARFLRKQPPPFIAVVNWSGISNIELQPQPETD